MVFIQHLPGVGHVQPVVRALVPGQSGQPIEVRADHSILGRRRGKPGKPVQFAPGLLFSLLRHADLVNLAPKLFDLQLLFITLAQLPLDGFELFAQEILALHLFHL